MVGIQMAEEICSIWSRRIDLPRTGRPPEVSEERFVEIKRELSENLAGWRAKEIMNIIYERTGVKYNEVHIYRLLHKWLRDKI
jgi:transposase